MTKNNSPSIEFQCLVQALKWDLGLPYLVDYFSESVDWTILFDRARGHRVRTILYEFLNAENVSHQVPGTIWQGFQQECLSCTLLNMELQRNYEGITRLFTEHKIQYLPLKGMALIEATDMPINRREFGDIDLLIREEQRQMARTHLYNTAYRNFAGLTEKEETAYTGHNTQMSYGLELDGEASPILDLHWALGHPNAGFEISFDELLPFCEKVSDGKFLLNGTGLAITLCAHHGGKDAWRHLRYLQDLGRLILNEGTDHVDWMAAYQFLKRKDLHYALLPALLSASHFLDIEVPKAMDALMDQKAKKLGLIINEQLTHGRPGYRIFGRHKFNFLVQIHSHTTNLDILKARIIHFFRPNYHDERWLPLPGYLSFLYIILRPVRLVKVYIFNSK